jgi:acyl-CoA thioester hydrolase
MAPKTAGFRYRRRVQFAETDMAGIVHFSTYFRYMEEAEHALWRAAGLTIAREGEATGWPRVAASFDYKAPLVFEDEFEVTVRIGKLSRRTMQYDFTIRRGDKSIGAGTITVACVSKQPGHAMKAIDLPGAIVEQLQAVVLAG